MSDVPRVALFPSAFHPHLGGIEETTRQLAHQLHARGGEPLICTHRWPRTLPAVERFEQLDVRRFRFLMPERTAHDLFRFAPRVPSIRRATRQALRSHGADLVHVQGVSNNAAYALHAARALHLPLVVTLQGELTMDATKVYERSAAHRRLLQVVLQRADAVSACSTHTLREAEEWAGLELGDRGTVIHNGVDATAFESDPSVERLHDRRYVAALGRLVPEKGFDILVEAFADIAGEQPDVDLLIAGEGPERPSLDVLIDRLGLRERVRLTGRLDRAGVAALLGGGEAFVLPSRHEPFGIVNLEAMAAGLPIVASAVGGVPELLGDVDGATLVPPGSPVALAEGMRTALAIGGRGRSARRHHARRYSWSAVAERYLAVYEGVRSPAPAPPAAAPRPIR